MPGGFFEHCPWDSLIWGSLRGASDSTKSCKVCVFVWGRPPPTPAPSPAPPLPPGSGPVTLRARQPTRPGRAAAPPPRVAGGPAVSAPRISAGERQGAARPYRGPSVPPYQMFCHGRLAARPSSGAEMSCVASRPAAGPDAGTVLWRGQRMRRCGGPGRLPGCDGPLLRARAPSTSRPSGRGRGLAAHDPRAIRALGGAVSARIM